MVDLIEQPMAAVTTPEDPDGNARAVGEQLQPKTDAADQTTEADETVEAPETILPAEAVRTNLEARLLDLTKLETYAIKRIQGKTPQEKMENAAKLKEAIQKSKDLVEGRLNGVNSGEGVLPSTLNHVNDHVNATLEAFAPYEIQSVEGEFIAWEAAGKKKGNSVALDLQMRIGPIIRDPETSNIAIPNKEVPPYYRTKLMQMRQQLM